jgi:hypothetical protein
LDEDDCGRSDDDNSTVSVVGEVANGDWLGGKMLEFWNVRKKKLISDVAITAWMVSPIPEIMEDVEQHVREH